MDPFLKNFYGSYTVLKNCQVTVSSGGKLSHVKFLSLSDSLTAVPSSSQTASASSLQEALQEALTYMAAVITYTGQFNCITITNGAQFSDIHVPASRGVNGFINKDNGQILNSAPLRLPAGDYLAYPIIVRTSSGTANRAHPATLYSGQTLGTPVADTMLKGWNAEIESGASAYRLKIEDISVSNYGRITSGVIGPRAYLINHGSLTDTKQNGGYLLDSTSNVTLGTNNALSLSDSLTWSASIHKNTTGSGIIVAPKGYLDIFSRGEAYEIKQAGGYVNIREGGTATFASNTFSDTVLSYTSATLHSGTTAVNMKISSGGTAYVYNGGLLITPDASLSSTAILYTGGTALFSEFTDPFNGLTSRIGNSTGIVSSGGSTITESGNKGVLIGVQSLETSALTVQNIQLLRTRERAYVYMSGVISGGTCGNNTSTSYNSISISSGGTVNQVLLNFGGNMIVSSGGTANYTTVNSGSYLLVSSGGIANSTTVNSGGNLQPREGGTANSATINANGRLYIYSGGTATEIMENGGNVYVADGATATFAPNAFSDLVLSSGQSATLHSGTTANSITINSGGTLLVFNEGTANSTTIYDSGQLRVSSGGTASYIGHPWINYYVTVQTGATVTHTIPNGIYYGNTASRLISSYNSNLSWYNIPAGNSLVVVGKTVQTAGLVYGGRLRILSSGNVNSVHGNFMRSCVEVSSGCTATVAGYSPWISSCVISAEGASITYTTSDGFYLARNGGIETLENTSSYPTIKSGSSLAIVGKHQTLSTTVGDKGYLVVIGGVSSGGTANYITVNSGGSMQVYSGGTASAAVSSGGKLYVSSGGTANATIDSGGSMYVGSGGVAVVSGALWVSNYVSSASGATVTYTVLPGVYYVSSGRSSSYNSLTELGVRSGGSLVVIGDGFNVSSCYILTGGSMKVYSRGSAFRTAVSYGGQMVVAEGGEANSTTVTGTSSYSTGVKIDPGFLFVRSGGTANFTKVNSYGYLYVSSGGTAHQPTVNSNGYLYVSSGGYADNVLLRSGGIVQVLNNGSLNKVTHVGEAGYPTNLYINSGGTATNISMGVAGVVLPLAGATASGIQLKSGAGLDVQPGASDVHYVTLAKPTSSDYGASAFIRSGAAINNVTISSGCTTIVYPSGLLNGATVSSGGTLTISSGASYYNTITSAQGAVVTIEPGALALIPTTT